MSTLPHLTSLLYCSMSYTWKERLLSEWLLKESGKCERIDVTKIIAFERRKVSSAGRGFHFRLRLTLYRCVFSLFVEQSWFTQNWTISWCCSASISLLHSCCYELPRIPPQQMWERKDCVTSISVGRQLRKLGTKYNKHSRCCNSYNRQLIVLNKVSRNFVATQVAQEINQHNIHSLPGLERCRIHFNNGSFHHDTHFVEVFIGCVVHHF